MLSALINDDADLTRMSIRQEKWNPKPGRGIHIIEQASDLLIGFITVASAQRNIPELIFLDTLNFLNGLSTFEGSCPRRFVHWRGLRNFE